VKIARLFTEKLSQDIAWTVGSFVILATSGILINLLVVGFRDTESLGVFNLTYAVYIVMSQFAVVGVQFSVLRYSAFYEANEQERADLLLAAYLLVLALGMIAAVVVFFAAKMLAELFDNELAGQSIEFAAMGLVLFPLNKILISYLNGLREMRAFAILQASRYLLVLACVGVIAVSSMSFAYAAVCFVIAEAVTTFAAALYIWRKKLARNGRLKVRWVHTHLAFGLKSFLAGMFVEMNSRVDVLLLGIYLEESLVGVYSFAAMLVDGVYHLIAMIRINFNPILVATVRDRRWEQGRSLLQTCKRYGFLGAGCAAAFVFCGFYVLTSVLLPDRALAQGETSLLLLLLGLTCIAPLIPFENLLMVSGHPAYQTLQHLLVVLANICVNTLLVPTLGIEGAALGAVAGYFVGIGTLILLSPKLVGWNLLTNYVSDNATAEVSAMKQRDSDW